MGYLLIVSLTPQDITFLCARYQEQKPRFERLAAEINRFLAVVLEKCAVKHMISHRAKGVGSFGRKLTKGRERYAFESFEGALSPPIKDLAAARVLLYLAVDIDPVVQAIESELRAAGHGVVPQDKRSLDRYSAYHFHVDCKGTAFNRGELSEVTVFEIQICTITAHVWNELEHDIIYKQPSGEPDVAQRELLHALHGELDLATRTAGRLMAHTQDLIAQNTAPIRGPEDLQHCLRNRAHGRGLKGDFGALYQLLAGILDPLTSASLHTCFQDGISEANAKQLVEEYDPDGSHGDVGALVLQLVVRGFNVELVDAFISSIPEPPSLLKFVRRVVLRVHNCQG